MIKTKDGKKRLLKAEEIECRVGQQTKDKSKYTVLLYKTSRCDMDILDEVFGMGNWQVDFKEIAGSLFCIISIWSEERQEWIHKMSNGSESNMEAEKGRASDSMKRAGFVVGVGRELYSAPKIWLEKEVDQYSLKVEAISYDDNDKICDLVISGRREGQKERETVYSFHNGKVAKQTPSKQPEPKAEPQPIGVDHDTLEKIRNIVDKLEFEGKNLDDILKFYGVKTIGEIPLEKWEKMLARVRGV